MALKLKRTLTWLTYYWLIVTLAIAYGFWVDHLQDINACRQRNESIKESVRVGGESILETAAKVSNNPPSEETISIYRNILEKNLKDTIVKCVK